MLHGFLVFLGAGVGGLTRYALASAIAGSQAFRQPLGTLGVNLLGCLLAGLAGAWLAGNIPMRDALRSAILIGALGGFTTFSAFARDAATLTDQGRGYLALAYILITNLGCLVAVMGGAAIYRKAFGA